MVDDVMTQDMPTSADKTRTQRQASRDKDFDNILNFRDIGKAINDFLGDKYALV